MVEVEGAARSGNGSAVAVFLGVGGVEGLGCWRVRGGDGQIRRTRLAGRGRSRLGGLMVDVVDVVVLGRSRGPVARWTRRQRGFVEATATVWIFISERGKRTSETRTL